jgi:predicted nucleic acid-binding protein
MSLVFLDTVGLLATWDESDQWHTGAVAAAGQIAAHGDDLFTTTFVLLECANALARFESRHKLDDLRRDLANGGLLI